MYDYIKLLDAAHNGKILRSNKKTRLEDVFNAEERKWEPRERLLWPEYTWIDGDYFGMYESLTKKEVDKLINAT